MAAKLADVARRAGVSITTVSRVLNNKMAMSIPPATVERIQRAAREMNYHPNALARGLALRRTQTIGLFTQEMTDPHFAQMLEAVEAKARARGYHIAVCSELEGILQGGRVDGVLMLASPRLFGDSALLVGTRAIFVWSAPRLLPGCIIWSDHEGAYEAGRYLLGLGHRRLVALFGDAPTLDPPLSKVAGFRQAMEEAGAAWREYQQALSADQFENGYLLTRRFLAERDGETAIFARNDFLALGAIKALHEAKIDVPGQISVVGYNDTMLARCADPPLTSVRTPIAEAGARAIDQLIQEIEAEEGPLFPGALLPTTITIRGSCAPPRRPRAISRSSTA